MKKSQAKAVVEVLAKKGEKALAKTFIATITSKTAQEELESILKDNLSSRNVKKTKGNNSKGADELVSKQEGNNSARNVKKATPKNDPIGTEFNSRKREAKIIRE